MPTIAQLKKIHALKKDLHLDDKRYHLLLAEHGNHATAPVTSSKELTVHQASGIIKSLEHLLEKNPDLFSHAYASDRQVRKIFALWHEVTGIHDTDPTVRTLKTFLEHHFHIRDFTHIPKRKVPKIIHALNKMILNKIREHENRDREAGGQSVLRHFTINFSPQPDRIP